MRRGSHILISFVALVSTLTACSRQNHSEIRAKHPDAILFERATTAIRQKNFDVANITLQTLVATYPDSEYVERAKRMLQDPQVARCGQGFSNTPPSLCDPEHTTVRRGQ